MDKEYKIKEFVVDIEDENSENNLIPFKILIHPEYLKKMINMSGLEPVLIFAQKYISDAITTSIDPNISESNLILKSKEEIVNNILNS